MRITEEQRSLNQKLHEKDTNYGNRYDGAGIATNITKAISRMNELEHVHRYWITEQEKVNLLKE